MSRTLPIPGRRALALAALALPALAANTLEKWAKLPAATFADGPKSGQYLGVADTNGQHAPFDRQPVQGFSAVLRLDDSTFQVMPDNGYGSIENSPDFNLRVYAIRPRFRTKAGGAGAIEVLGHIELHDPDHKIPFALVNGFSADRALTGSDFDIESVQRGRNGTVWFGDEFGPFLLHTDSAGKVLEAPYALPDFDHPGRDVRAPQNPYNEEVSALRVMNAFRAHAQAHGDLKTPVFSPEDDLFDDGDSTRGQYSRGDSISRVADLAPASSKIFNVTQLRAAGYPVVCWTVNDTNRMWTLLNGVKNPNGTWKMMPVTGMISDRPDLLMKMVRKYAADTSHHASDWFDADSLLKADRFDAQAHRGGRNLRPENTLPSFENGLDNLVTTLETDIGLSKDTIPVISHDPHLQHVKCRYADTTKYYGDTAEALIKDYTRAEIQSRWVCDEILPDSHGPTQRNDTNLSPVAVAFAHAHGLPHPYAPPTLQDLFDFVAFYVDYYKAGAGKDHPLALRRWKNAAKVRFNIETKVNPRHEYEWRTLGWETFARVIPDTIMRNHMQDRADLQSFDFRTLKYSQEHTPRIRTVYLFGDFPIFRNPNDENSDDGTNMQPDGANTPWMAGLYWPYRSTVKSNPFRAQTSGGFEGMALTPDGRTLLPLLEKPLAGDDPKTILMHEFDIASRRYTGVRHKYKFDSPGTSIGDFILYNPTQGLAIERDNFQGSAAEHKVVYQVTLKADGQYVAKDTAVDLLRIANPDHLADSAAGDVKAGDPFGFPFVTIEDVVVLDATHIGVLNDNNYPFSVGRHAGTGKPDDDEFMVIKLDRPLDLATAALGAGPKAAPAAARLPLARWYDARGRILKVTPAAGKAATGACLPKAGPAPAVK